MEPMSLLILFLIGIVVVGVVWFVSKEILPLNYAKIITLVAFLLWLIYALSKVPIM